MTFIHPFYSIVESYWSMYIWGNYFQWDYVTNLNQHHLLSMLITGALNFFVGTDVRGGSSKSWGHLYFGVDIILIKHHVNQQWVQTGWLVPSSAELTAIFPSITVLLIIGRKMRTSGAAVFTFLRHNVNAHFTIGPNTCPLATVTVGRPSRVKVQETDNSLCPWSCWSVSH